MEEKKDKKETAMSKNDTKSFTTSKLWLLVTGILFIAVVLATFILTGTKQDIFDTTIYATAITVSGAIFGSNLCWYSKKAAGENQYKLRMSMYEDTVTQRLYFNEEMIKMKKKYGITDDDICDIDNQGDIDEFMDDELHDLKNKLDMDRDDTESPNELKAFDSIY